jgi:hypothetical protein
MPPNFVSGEMAELLRLLFEGTPPLFYASESLADLINGHFSHAVMMGIPTETLKPVPMRVDACFVRPKKE